MGEGTTMIRSVSIMISVLLFVAIENTLRNGQSWGADRLGYDKQLHKEQGLPNNCIIWIWLSAHCENRWQ